MRKIKSFRLFESKEKFSFLDKNIVSIQQEAKDNLAYLLDEGQFKISYEMGNLSGLPTSTLEYCDYLVVTIEIINRRVLDKTVFGQGISWQSIKDDVMPYLELVSDKYTLWKRIRGGYIGHEFWFNRDMTETYNLSELEDINKEIHSISFRIMNN